MLTSFSKTFYFLDRARQRGMTYELMKQFEKTLNEKYETKHRKITVVFVPVARDRLIPALIEGRGDIAAANLTITPERKALVEFSDPLYWGVKELIVTAPGTAKPKSIECPALFRSRDNARIALCRRALPAPPAPLPN